MDESVWRGKIYFGGAANLEALTDTRWVTIRGDIAPYPF
jgi:benzaldehyde dehydrogenase (NAD)